MRSSELSPLFSNFSGSQKFGNTEWRTGIAIVVSRNPTWHICSDQCEGSWQGLVGLVYGVGLNATISWDRIHRLTNDVASAQNSAGLRFVMEMFRPVLSMRNGPWGRAANHEVVTCQLCKSEWVRWSLILLRWCFQCCLPVII